MDKLKQLLTTSTAKVLLIVLALSLVVLVWVIRHKNSDTKYSTDSYAGCVSEGNPVLESYPEQCIDKQGRHYTNPDAYLKPLVPSTNK